MKRVLFTAALLLTAASAHATYCPDHSLIASHPNGNCNVPIPNPSPPAAVPSQTQSSNAAAAANAAANASAAAKSSSSSQATGGSARSGDSSANANGGAGGSASANGTNQLSGVGNDNSSTSFRGLALSLPSPVFTPPMPLASCPQANVEQEAHAVGWNFYSQAHGSVNTDNCTAIIVYNAMLDQCQYESAQNVLDGLMVKVMPGYKPKAMSGLNLTAKECRDIKFPPQAIAPVNFVTSGPDYHIIDRGPACPAPAPLPVASKKKSKTKRVAMITECKG